LRYDLLPESEKAVVELVRRWLLDHLVAHGPR
jgi:hypothetical protein